MLRERRCPTSATKGLEGMAKELQTLGSIHSGYRWVEGGSPGPQVLGPGASWGATLWIDTMTQFGSFLGSQHRSAKTRYLRILPTLHI